MSAPMYFLLHDAMHEALHESLLTRGRLIGSIALETKKATIRQNKKQPRNTCQEEPTESMGKTLHSKATRKTSCESQQNPL